MSEKCVFCDITMPNLAAICVHVLKEHFGEKIKVWHRNRSIYRESRCRRFSFQLLTRDGTPAYGTHRRIRCLCRAAFTVNTLPGLDSVFGSPGCTYELDSWLAHLKREGGLAAHLQKLTDQAMLDRVAGKR